MGFESSSLALSLAAYELVANPDVRTNYRRKAYFVRRTSKYEVFGSSCFGNSTKVANRSSNQPYLSFLPNKDTQIPLKFKSGPFAVPENGVQLELRPRHSWIYWRMILMKNKQLNLFYQLLNQFLQFTNFCHSKVFFIQNTM